MKSSLFTRHCRLRNSSATATAVAATTTIEATAPSIWRRRSSALAAALAPNSTVNRFGSHTCRSKPPSFPSLTASSAAVSRTTTDSLYFAKRSHYSYADGPGRFAFSVEAVAERHAKRLQSWDQRGFTVGIGGPVGSGKTALVLALIKRLGAGAGESPGRPPLAVVTNDIFTQEDAQFLWRNQDVLDASYIKAVETGGCPHAAIREDVSANLTACEDLTEDLRSAGGGGAASQPPLILCESGGDNLAANFSGELADLTLYVIDVAGGDKVPRKGGPGITQSDLLVINKIDLAEAVGADLGVMRRDADRMRRATHDHGHDHDHDHSHDHDHAAEEDEDDFHRGHPDSGPTVFASVKKGTSVDEIEAFILEQYRKAIAPPA